MSDPVLRPPRKWIGRKGGLVIVATGGILWVGTVLFGLLVAHVEEAPTLGLVIGAFTVAAAFVYTMAYRLRPTDDLGVGRLLIAFVAGGLLSATFASPLDKLVELTFHTPIGAAPIGALSLAGVVEEFAKIWVVILMARGLAVRTARNGLFLGAAVGFGFAGYENISYARDAWNAAYHAFVSPLGQEAWVVISRDILGIFGHPLFTGLLAAAVFASTRNGRFRLSWRVALAYLGVAFAHGLFDAGGEIVYRLTAKPILGTITNWAIYVVEAVVLALIWRVVSLRSNAAAAAALAHAGTDGEDELVAIEPTASKDEVAAILATLPEWFGIPEHTTDYALAADRMAGYRARDRASGQVLGVALVTPHSAESAELYLIAVSAGNHHNGVGSRLLRRIESDLREAGARILSVKTLGPSRPDEGYEKTRLFYESHDFIVVEELEDLWPENPCLLMVKQLRPAS